MKFIRFSYLLILLLAANTVSTADSISGKKLFSEHCSRCHKPGRILIGPDIRNIRDKRPSEWLLGFVKNSPEYIHRNDKTATALYNEYLQTEMPPVDLSNEEIIAIFDYIDNFYPVPITPREQVNEKPSIYAGSKIYFFKTLIVAAFWVLLPLLILYGISIFRKKKFKIPLFFKIYTGIILSISLFILTQKYSDFQNDIRLTGSRQPVVFSHKLHFKTYDIDCIYCHIRALKSEKANLPGTALCMKCHDYIVEGEEFGKKELKKLSDLSENGEKIIWITGYRLPPYVHFNHNLHTVTGSLGCLDCHKLNEEPLIMQFSFTMGFCIDCHQQKKIVSENHYYSFLLDSTKINLKPEEWGTDCSLCHY